MDTSLKNKTSSVDRTLSKTSRNSYAYYKSDDSLIVHDLIMTRFDKVLHEFSQRSLKRQRSRQESGFTTESDLSADDQLESKSEVRKKRKSKIDSVFGSSDFVLDGGLKNEMMHSTPKNSLDSLKPVDEYDEKKFLEDALGQNYTKNESHLTENRSNTSLEHSKTGRSINTTDLSTLLSLKVSSLYSSVKKVCRCIQLRNITSLEDPEVPQKEDIHDRTISRAEKLNEEYLKLSQKMLQVSKCLSLCRTSRDFKGSAGHIEAEKILLETAYKKEILVHEMNKIEYEEIKEAPPNYGLINISRLIFSLKELDEQVQHRDFSQYFLCILYTEDTVLSSEVVTPTDGYLIFNDQLNFENLLPDFQVALDLYSLKVPNRIIKKTNNLNNHNFFSLPRSRRNYMVDDQTQIKTSAFTLLGKSNIRLANLSQTRPLALFNTPLSSPVYQLFSAEIESGVRLQSNMRGFLTIGNSGCTLWNRRWCVLEGATFKYWNYPSKECTSPIEVLDLQYCLNYKITTVDRSLCPRPRTLAIDLQRNDTDFTILRYLLLADSMEEMREWETQLNATIESLRVWNNMNSQAL